MRHNKYIDQNGFSLLEILVALAVLAMLLGVMMRISSAVLQNTGVSEDYRMAGLVTESLLAELDIENRQIGSVETASTADGYRWQQVVKPHYPTQLHSGFAEPYDVTIKVEWGEADKPRHITLETIRLLRSK